MQLLKLSINIKEMTSIDITQNSVNKMYSLKKLHNLSKISLKQMMFISDTIFSDSNDYSVKKLRLKTVHIKNLNSTIITIVSIVTCFK